MSEGEERRRVGLVVVAVSDEQFLQHVQRDEQSKKNVEEHSQRLYKHTRSDRSISRGLFASFFALWSRGPLEKS